MSQASMLHSLPPDHFVVAHEPDMPVNPPECFECLIYKPDDKDRFLPVMRKIKRTINDYILGHQKDSIKKGKDDKPLDAVSEWFKGKFLFAVTAKQILVDAFAAFNLQEAEAILLQKEKKLTVKEATLDFNEEDYEGYDDDLSVDPGDDGEMFFLQKCQLLHDQVMDTYLEIEAQLVSLKWFHGTGTLPEELEGGISPAQVSEYMEKVTTDRKWLCDNIGEHLRRHKAVNQRWKILHMKSDKMLYRKTLSLCMEGDLEWAAACAALAVQSRPGNERRLKLQREIEERRQFEKVTGVIRIRSCLMPGPKTINKAYWCDHLLKSEEEGKCNAEASRTNVR